MTHHGVTIHFENETEEHLVKHEAPLQILDRDSHWMMERFDCRKAECGLCLIYVTEGWKNLNSPGFIEQQTLKAMRAPANCRLACQCRVLGPVTIELHKAIETI